MGNWKEAIKHGLGNIEKTGRDSSLCGSHAIAQSSRPMYQSGSVFLLCCESISATSREKNDVFPLAQFFSLPVLALCGRRPTQFFRILSWRRAPKYINNAILITRYVSANMLLSWGGSERARSIAQQQRVLILGEEEGEKYIWSQAACVVRCVIY